MFLAVNTISAYRWVADLLYKYPFLFTVMTFVIGGLFMPLVIRIAREKNMVVRPNKRTAHMGNIPNIGGLDIFLSFLIFFILFAYNHVENAHYVVTGIVMIWIVGFLDDLIVFKPLTKLIGELLAAIMLVLFADIHIDSLYGLFGIYELSEWVSYLLSVFVVVALMNALNLIDGVDGLASGLGMLYSLCFALYFRSAGEDVTSVVAFALIGALGVFFIYNVFGGSHKIFMGDSGSLMLGYLLSWFTFRVFQINQTNEIDVNWHISAVPAVCFTLLFIPVFDTMRVMLTRMRQHRSPFNPDRNHVHHLLLRCGLKHREVTFVLLGISLLFVTLAYVGRNWSNELLIGVSLLLGIILTFILWRVVDYCSKRIKDPFFDMNNKVSSPTGSVGEKVEDKDTSL